MSGILSSSTSAQSAQTTVYTGLMIQTSVYGKCIPLVYGQTRIAGNLIWYGDFTATPQSSSSGGKGGIGGTGGSGKGGTSSGQYNYSASFVLALSEGPVTGVLTVYYDKNIDTLASLGFSFFPGSYPQTAWSWLTSHYGPIQYQAPVPTSAPFTVQVPNGESNFMDLGITGPILPYTQLTRVNLSPAAGQFALAITSTVDGVYTYYSGLFSFNAANVGMNIIITAGPLQWTGTIPANLTMQISSQSPFGTVSVAAAAQGAYTAVTASPTANQYMVTATGLYTFNSANGGANVTISYTSATQSPPDQTLGYNGIAYIAQANYQLGSSAEIPNFNFEVQGTLAASAQNGIDADPAQVLTDLLTNVNYGVDFPANYIGSLTGWQNWCRANGLWISPAYTDQAQTSNMLADLATYTMSDFVWSAGKLTIVPYGTAAVSGNGASWSPPAAPLFDLDDTDFMPNTNATGSSATTNDDAVLLTRTRQADAYNSIKLEYLDRSNDYNTAVLEAKDQAGIDQFGLRQDSTQSAHMFCDVNAAQTAVQMLLQRQYVRNTYQFTLDQRYIVLDPMDVVAITDARLGLNQQWVRIIEITENDDASLSISAEEFIGGQGAMPLYGQQTAMTGGVNYNSAPGPMNTPIIFEPTAELAEELAVWLAVSGGANWGGADVWISNDGNAYSFAGRITGGARTGVLTAGLASITPATSGQTIDSIDTLAVDLGQSDGQLASGTQQDATSLSTLCYVDGEYIAYQNAELVTGNLYNLSYLVRGAYGSTIGYHPTGAAFARMDNGIFKLPAYTSDKIGDTIYIKFLSFNIYGGGQPTLSSVEPVTYTLKGTALASPPADVTNLRTSYVASNTALTWDEITDFRTVLYEIRKGGGWNGAQVMGRVAHPPFAISGNDTYWVGTLCQPAAGLAIYGEDPQDLAVSGANIVSNVIAAFDEGATGWSGTVSGSVAVVGGAVRTIGTGNLLTAANLLTITDVLNYGSEGSGIYTIPASHIVNIGRVAPCQLLISWSCIGQNVTDNMLALGDVLGSDDLLDYACSALTSVYPEIALSQNGSSWGSWQKYAPGFYTAMAFQARMQIATSAPAIEAILESMVFSVDVPDRDDHYTNLSIPATGYSLTFTPDGSATPAAFNGGPGGASVPALQITILNATAGDQAVISSVTKSGCTIQILNGGTGVARTINLLAEGY